MNIETQQQIIAMLKTLADKLGTTADYLWSVMVHQAIVEAYTNIAILAVAWFALGVLVLIVRKNIKDDDWITVVVFGCAILGMLSAFILSRRIPMIINPEFWALNEILRTIK